MCCGISSALKISLFVHCYIINALTYDSNYRNILIIQIKKRQMCQARFFKVLKRILTRELQKFRNVRIIEIYWQIF